MIRILIPIGLLVAGGIVHLMLSRRNEKKVQAEWAVLLSPSSERVFQQARMEVESHTSMIDVAVTEAREIRQLGNVEEAVRFLNIGCDIIHRFTPNLLSLLAVMTRFSRMVSAIAPITPIVPGDFHLAELTNLARLNRLLHHMLASAKQRFRLKLYILGKGLSLTSQYLIRTIGNIVSGRSHEEREWDEVVDITQDFQKLSNESVLSLRVLLEALSSDAAKELSRTISLPQPHSSHD
ncbi:MAG: hypothetical protein AB1898_21935 [Acidobacteriota bacterium]